MTTEIPDSVTYTRGTYEWIDEWLGGVEERRGWGQNEWVMRDYYGGISVRLHRTDIVTFSKDGPITLNSEGYETVTTKAHINSLLPEQFVVAQRHKLWVLCTPQGAFYFEDKMVVDPEGNVLQHCRPYPSAA